MLALLLCSVNYVSYGSMLFHTFLLPPHQGLVVRCSLRCFLVIMAKMIKRQCEWGDNHGFNRYNHISKISNDKHKFYRQSVKGWIQDKSGIMYSAVCVFLLLSEAQSY